MRAYLAVLAVGDARRIVVALALTRLGYGMIGLAVVLLAYDVTGSFAIAGLAVGVFTLASGLLAPLRGSLVDRFGQTRPLVVYVPLYTTFCLALSVATSPTLLVLLAGLAGASSPPLIASARPLWAGIVGEDLLRPAYALDSVSMQTTQVIGPALAGLLAAATSPRLAVAALGLLVACRWGALHDEPALQGVALRSQGRGSWCARLARAAHLAVVGCLLRLCHRSHRGRPSRAHRGDRHRSRRHALPHGPGRGQRRRRRGSPGSTDAAGRPACSC